MSTCAFHPSPDCNSTCVDDFFTKGCSSLCVGNYQVSNCSSDIKCFSEDSSCLLETLDPCIKKKYDFDFFNFCSTQDRNEVFLAKCGNESRMEFKLQIKDKAYACSTPRTKDKPVFANCNCKSCEKNSGTCNPETFTRCSCYNDDSSVQDGTSSTTGNGYSHMFTTESTQSTQPIGGIVTQGASVSMTTKGASSMMPSVIGGAVGGVVAVAIVILLVVAFLCYHRKKRHQKADTGVMAFKNNTYHTTDVYEEDQKTLGERNNVNNAEVATCNWEQNKKKHSDGYSSVSPTQFVNDDSDYNMLNEKPLSKFKNGDDEQYDHVKAIRGQPGGVEDYDELNKFSKISDNDPNDDYDHCKTVHTNQKGGVLETPEDDYDHCRMAQNQQGGKFTDTPDDDYDHCRTVNHNQGNQFVEKPEDDYDHCRTDHHQGRDQFLETPDNDYDHIR